jgi:hypothetical protein
VASIVPAPPADAAPPESRRYERVTPADKNFAEVTQGIASADGEHVQVNALSTAFGDAFGNPLTSYTMTRTASGWETRAVNFRTSRPTAVSPVLADASDDLRHQVVFGTVVSTAPPTDVTDSLDVRHDGAGRRVHEQATMYSDGDLRYAGMDADAAHVLFHSSAVLTAAAAQNRAGRLLYLDTAEGQRLVGVRDDGETLVSTCGAVLGNGALVGVGTGGGGSIGAISDDGESIVFQSPDPAAFGDPSCEQASGLYVRQGARTVEVSAPRAGAPADAPADATYQGASSDGAVVFFTTERRLLPDMQAGGTHLYAYDVRGDRLAAVSDGDGGSVGGDVRGAVGFSRDGSVAYFVAGAVLAPGAAAAEPNLYRWKAGTTRFVATLTASDAATYTATGEPGQLEARVSADGDRLAFRSTADLAPGAATGGTGQIFLYDANRTGDLRCASCRSDGNASTAAATLNGSTAQLQAPTAVRHTAAGMSEDGRYVFFQSADRVVPEATNGKSSVYAWRDGRADLVSGGKGNDDALYIGNSASGRDVFFATNDRLIPEDRDGSYDIYDARVGGGFDVPPAPDDCVDDACQGAPAVAPPSAAPASDAVGPGNPRPQPASRPRAKPRLIPRTVTAGERGTAVRTGVLRLRVRVVGTGRVRARATARVGGRTRRVAIGVAVARRSGTTGTVLLRLTAAARAELRRTGRLRVHAVLTMAGARPRTTTITLKTRSAK